MKIKTQHKAHILILSCLFLAGCKSLPTNAMQTARVELTHKADGTESFRLSGLFPKNAYLSGTAESFPDEKKTLSIESFHWFENWNDGWTEASFSASGILSLDKNDGSGNSSVLEKPVIEYPASATIRYRDTIIEGDEGLKQAGNRWNRISAASVLLKAEFASGFPSIKEFRKQAGKFLFPEVYGYQTSYAKTKATKENRVYAEDFTWDLDYSNAVLPADFREIRNSGTLFRDWEEGSELFYLAYGWDRIFSNTGPVIITFSKKEK